MNYCNFLQCTYRHTKSLEVVFPLVILSHYLSRVVCIYISPSSRVIYIYISPSSRVIYIYIYHHHQSMLKHRFPWLSLTIHPYPLSLPEGLPDYILCSYRAVVGRFLLASELCMSIWGSLLENITYEFILASLAVSCMSCLSSFNGFRDRK